MKEKLVSLNNSGVDIEATGDMIVPSNIVGSSSFTGQ